MEWPLLVASVFGGCAPEALRWYRIREESMPDWAKRPRYWVITAVMVAFGPVLVWVYQSSGVEMNPVVAFNIGASVPLAMTTMASQPPPIASAD